MNAKQSNFKPHQSAFTLLECLLTFCILAVLLHALSFGWQYFRQLDQAVRNDRSLDWQHFCLLMTHELDHFYVEVINSQTLGLQLKEPPHQRSTIILNNAKLYRRPGHQPYLYGVRSWQVSSFADFLTISVELENQQVFSHRFQIEHGEAFHEAD